MNLRKQLIARRDLLQSLFDAETQKETDAAHEKLRLQGEYRLTAQLLEIEDKKEKEETSQ